MPLDREVIRADITEEDKAHRLEEDTMKEPIVQLLTDPENQPHQFVGDPFGLLKEMNRWRVSHNQAEREQAPNCGPPPQNQGPAEAHQWVPPLMGPNPFPASPKVAQSRPTPSEVDDLWVGLCEDGDLLADGKEYLADPGLHPPIILEDPSSDKEVCEKVEASKQEVPHTLADSHDTYVRVLKLLVADGTLPPDELLRAVQLARLLL